MQFDDEIWAAFNLLRQERRRRLQQLAEEAFKDLLLKYRHPVGLKDQLQASAGNSDKKSTRAD